MELAEEIYFVTSKKEIYSLTAQIKRVAISMLSNISDYPSKNLNKKYGHFLYSS
jgi:four helix bundle protein